MVNYEELSNVLIDWFCEAYSPNECIELLIRNQYAKEELLELGFMKEDIDNVFEDLKNPKKLYL